MIASLPPLLLRLLTFFSTLLLLSGAAGVVAGTLGPWATFKLFHNIEVNLPGIVFLWGGLCLTLAALVFLGMRRSPILCLLAALGLFYCLHQAQRDVPDGIRRQMVGAQGALVPINRLLDQFHVNGANGSWPIEVASFQDRQANLLGEGLDWTAKGASVLLLGSILGLPGDPVAVWIYTRTARVRCRACGTRWPVSRQAKFCPRCGASTLPKHIRLCLHCGLQAKRGDHHCVACGTDLSTSQGVATG